MKLTKDQIAGKSTQMPAVRFSEEARLSRFGGIVLLGHLFSMLNLRRRVARCFEDDKSDEEAGYERGGILLLLITMLLLGYRRLSDVQWLRGELLLQRVLGWTRLPSAATLSRALSSVSETSVEKVRTLSRAIALDALGRDKPKRVTLDFDGSVQSTQGHAEGTAVGFNKKKRGARSYWPLFATLNGRGLFLDVLHRAGNVHDSTGAHDFMVSCVKAVRSALPEDAEISTRTDAAFFDHRLVGVLDDNGVTFTCSVPFARMAGLKACVEACTIWEASDGSPAPAQSTWAYASCLYSPGTWSKAGRRYRFILVRQRQPVQRKGPLQLDLFEPVDHVFTYSVVVTNDWTNAPPSIVEHHHGRGSQEKLFGEAKQDVALGHIATGRLMGNRLFTLAGMLAHNLGRELQAHLPSEHQPRVPHRVRTLRRRWFELPARLTFPQRRPVLTVHAATTIAQEFTALTNALADVA